MNDAELEAQLRRLKPMPPSPALLARLSPPRPAAAGRVIPLPDDRRVLRALRRPVETLHATSLPDPQSSAGGLIAWPRRLALPLAAAAALVMWLATPRTPAPAPVVAQRAAPRFEAVDAQEYILGTEALGIGHDETGRPYRVLRSYGVRREVWRNTADGSEVASVVPQQQLLLAKMDVY